MDFNLVPIIGCVLVALALAWMLWPKSMANVVEPKKENIHELLSRLIASAPNAKSKKLLREAGQAFYEADDGQE
jgi:hypothetical protein